MMEGRADSNLSKLIVNGKDRADEHGDRSERSYQEKYVLPAKFIRTFLYAFINNPKLSAVFQFKPKFKHILTQYSSLDDHLF